MKCPSCARFPWQSPDGLRVYGLGDQPAHLATRPQLRWAGLRPGGPPEAWIHLQGLQGAPYAEHPHMRLYDRHTAQPLRLTAAQQEALRAGRNRLEAIRQAEKEEEERQRKEEERRLYQEAQQSAISEAQDLTADPDLLVLDTETTGLEEGAEAVEVAVLSGAGEVLLDKLVKPVGPIGDPAAEIHGLDAQAVADAPPWPAVHQHLAPLLTGATRLVIYNADYDVRIIRDSAAAWGLDTPVPDHLQVHCAMDLVARYYTEPHPRTGRWKWQPLDRAATDLGVAPGGHRAAGDARATLEVLRQIAKQTPDEAGP